MPVADYFAASEKAIRLVDTLQLEVRMSYNSAQNGLRDADGLVDMQRLVTQSDAFGREIANNLETKALDYFGIDPATANIFDKARAMLGYAGFGRAKITDFTNSAGPRANFDAFYTQSSKGDPNNNVPSWMQPALEAILTAPSLTLSAADALEVITYTNTAGKVDPAQLTNPQDMVFLLETFKAKGKIRDADLVGKRYLVQGYTP